MARHIRRGNATRSAIRACVRLRERAHGSDHPLNRPNPCEGPHDHGQPELQTSAVSFSTSDDRPQPDSAQIPEIPALANPNSATQPQILPILTFNTRYAGDNDWCSRQNPSRISVVRGLQVLFFIHLSEQIHVQIFPRSPTWFPRCV